MIDSRATNTEEERARKSIGRYSHQRVGTHGKQDLSGTACAAAGGRGGGKAIYGARVSRSPEIQPESWSESFRGSDSTHVENLMLQATSSM